MRFGNAALTARSARSVDPLPPFADTPVMNDRVVIDPRICHGKPVIRGTRVPVSIVVGSLAGGMTFEEVEREYSLTRDDIRAALKFAGELVEQEQHHPLAPAR